MQGHVVPSSTTLILQFFLQVKSLTPHAMQVLKFVDEQIAIESVASPQAPDMQLLWRLLRLLVHHNGALRPPGGVEKEKVPPKAKSGQAFTGLPPPPPRPSLPPFPSSVFPNELGIGSRRS